MFDTDTLRVFASRFPTLTSDQVREAADWVARLDAREHLDNPSAMLESVLQKRANALHAMDAQPKPPSSPRPHELRDAMSETEWKRSDEARRIAMADFYAKHPHLKPAEPQA